MAEASVVLSIGRGLWALRDEAAAIEAMLDGLGDAASTGRHADPSDAVGRLRAFIRDVDRFQELCRSPVAELRERLALAAEVPLKQRAELASWLDSLDPEFDAIRSGAAQTLSRLCEL